MFPALSHDIVADRYTPHFGYIDFVGHDLTSATLAMQVRDAPNGGFLRLDLDQVDNSSGLQGVRLEVVSEVDGVFTSRVAWLVSESSMEELPLDAADPTADLVLHYDLHITDTLPVMGYKFVGARGLFTVRAGVTQ